MVRIRGWLGMAADVATLAAIGIGLLIGAVVGAWTQLQKVGLAWSVVAAVGVAVIIFAGVKGSIRRYRNRTDAVGEEKYFREKRLRLSDLVVPGSPIVLGRTFERCRIIGPGFINFRNSMVDAPTFQTSEAGGLEAVLVEVPPGKQLIGVVGFVSCTFRECLFENIAIVDVRAGLDHVRGAIVTPAVLPAAGEDPPRRAVPRSPRRTKRGRSPQPPSPGSAGRD